MAPHFEAGGTEWNAVLIDPLGSSCGIGMLPLSRPPSREDGDDGVDLFPDQVLVVAEAVVTGIVDGGVEDNLERMFSASLDEAVEALEREGEIAFAGLGDDKEGRDAGRGLEKARPPSDR